MSDAPHQAASANACASFLHLLRGGIPIVIQQSCVLLVCVITVARVGHSVSAEALAGVSLGNLTYNLLGLTLIMGPMIALETHASQAWGAKRPAEVGLHAQRAVIVAAVVLVPAAVAWLFAERILRQLGQGDEVARLAARFLRGMLPVLPIQVTFEASKRFLYAQGIMWPPALAGILGTGTHLAVVGPIVEALGFDGAPVALLVGQGTMLLVLLLYLACVRYPPEAFDEARGDAPERGRGGAQRAGSEEDVDEEDEEDGDDGEEDGDDGEEGAGVSLQG